MMGDYDTQPDLTTRVEIVPPGIHFSDGSIVILTGVISDETDIEHGDHVGIVAEPRYVRDIIDALQADEEVFVHVEPWQMWGTW